MQPSTATTVEVAGSWPGIIRLTELQGRSHGRNRPIPQPVDGPYLSPPRTTLWAPSRGPAGSIAIPPAKASLQRSTHHSRGDQGIPTHSPGNSRLASDSPPPAPERPATGYALVSPNCSSRNRSINPSTSRRIVSSGASNSSASRVTITDGATVPSHNSHTRAAVALRANYRPSSSFRNTVVPSTNWAKTLGRRTSGRFEQSSMMGRGRV